MTSHPGLVIVGLGDHARVMIEAARAAGHELVGLVDPAPADHTSSPSEVEGLAVLGKIHGDKKWAPSHTVRFLVAVGRNDVRMRVFRECLAEGWVPAAVIHPTATILGGARIEAGAQVCARAVIGVSATVGANAIVNTAASIDHDNQIAEHATVAPGAHLAGRVQVGEGAFIGIGAIVREGLSVGGWSLVAAGAVVIRDVGPAERVAGVPAQPMRQTELESSS
ncbi:MAG TPA: acetyltransferase [Candidatus Limnocylindrales bacterium]|nr:acetyltransferase [Candidatus Limnocylindrales bacterium]